MKTINRAVVALAMLLLPWSAMAQEEAGFLATWLPVDAEAPGIVRIDVRDSENGLEAEVWTQDARSEEPETWGKGTARLGKGALVALFASGEERHGLMMTQPAKDVLSVRESGREDAPRNARLFFREGTEPPDCFPFLPNPYVKPGEAAGGGLQLDVANYESYPDVLLKPFGKEAKTPRLKARVVAADGNEILWEAPITRIGELGRLTLKDVEAGSVPSRIVLRLIDEKCGTVFESNLVTTERQASPAGSITIWPGQALCGETVDLPVHLSGASKLEAFGLVLTYDPSCLEFTDVLPGAGTEKWANVQGARPAPGQVIVGGIRGFEEPVDGDTELFVVRFRCVGPCPCDSTVGATRLVDGIAGYDVHAGTVTCAPR